jgi:CheY-like chemotaxis protein
VGHTLEVSASEAFLEIDRRPEVGEAITVRLSFPRFFRPVEHAARVTRHVEGEGLGAPSGVEIAFEHPSPEEYAGFAAVLARLERSSGSIRVDATYRVLVVEDNEFIRDMFVYGVDKYFRGHHATVRVETAADGDQAWRKLVREDYDLAIVDHYLPVMDGTALLSRVRREPKLAGMPLVGVSVGGTEVKSAMLQAGADLFLSKPIVLRDLLQTLERLATAGAVQ